MSLRVSAPCPTSRHRRTPGSRSSSCWSRWRSSAWRRHGGHARVGGAGRVRSRSGRGRRSSSACARPSTRSSTTSGGAGSGFVAGARRGPGRGLPAVRARYRGARRLAGRARCRTRSRRGYARAQRGARQAARGRRGRRRSCCGSTGRRSARPSHRRAASRPATTCCCSTRTGASPSPRCAQVLPPLDLELDRAASRRLARRAPSCPSCDAARLQAASRRRDRPVQLVRALGAGPATPVVDFVTRFEVEWHAAAACRRVRVAPDGSPAVRHRRAAAAAGRRRAAPQWPAGENCAFAATPAAPRLAVAAAAPTGAGAARRVRRRAVVSLGRGAVALGRRSGARHARHVDARRGRGLGAATPCRQRALGSGRGARVVPDITVVAELTPGAHDGRR